MCGPPHAMPPGSVGAARAGTHRPLCDRLHSHANMGCIQPFPSKQGLRLGYGSYAHLLRHCMEHLDPLSYSRDAHGMRACHSCMRPIAACSRADGAGLRDADRHMVGLWRVARQFWKALNECFQESIGCWGPRVNPASKEKVPCTLIPWEARMRLLGRLIAAGDRGEARLSNSFGTDSVHHRIRWLHGLG